ncbi:MAG TPA: hypothetical protein VNJ01_15145 [Bacteriovoracaceae bacterium]|nr:hypothetical protein [Bacteriovoracaceae bacterium]
MNNTLKAFLLLGMSIYGTTSFAVCTAPAGITGQLQYNGTNYQFCNGTAWNVLNTGSSGGQWTTTGPDIYYNTGKVGIGLINPTMTFEIQGAGTGFGSLAEFRSTGATDRAQLILRNAAGGDAAMHFASNSAAWNIGRDQSDGGKFKFSTDVNSDLGFNTLLTIDTSGKMGIGIASPTAALEVNTGAVQGLKITNAALTDANPLISAHSPLASVAAAMVLYPGGKLAINSSANTNNLSVSGMMAVGPAYLNIAAPTNGAIIEGNVGIGTSAPDAKLQVRNRINIGAPASAPYGILGIGTAAASYATLAGQVDGSVRLADAFQWTIANPLFVQGEITASAGLRMANGTLLRSNLSFPLYLAANNSTTAHVTISTAGNFGIGTTSPAAKLDVAGEVKFGNTLSTCNAANEGQQRYNSTTKVMEFCNGTAWTAPGGAPSGTACGLAATSTYPGGGLWQDGPTYASATCLGSTIGWSQGSFAVTGCPTGYTGKAFLLREGDTICSSGSAACKYHFVQCYKD